MTRSEITKLDEAWSQAIKVRAGYVCEFCGRGGWIEAAHVAGRRYRFTRWGAVINERYDPCGHALCHCCHQNYDDHGPLEGYIVGRVVGKRRKHIIQHAATILGSSQDFETIMHILEGYKNEKI